MASPRTLGLLLVRTQLLPAHVINLQEEQMWLGSTVTGNGAPAMYPQLAQGVSRGQGLKLSLAQDGGTGGTGKHAILLTVLSG